MANNPNQFEPTDLDDADDQQVTKLDMQVEALDAALNDLLDEWVTDIDEDDQLISDGGIAKAEPSPSAEFQQPTDSSPTTETTTDDISSDDMLSVDQVIAEAAPKTENNSAAETTVETNPEIITENITDNISPDEMLSVDQVIAEDITEQQLSAQSDTPEPDVVISTQPDKTPPTIDDVPDTLEEDMQTLIDEINDDTADSDSTDSPDTTDIAANIQTTQKTPPTGQAEDITGTELADEIQQLLDESTEKNPQQPTEPTPQQTTEQPPQQPAEQTVEQAPQQAAEQTVEQLPQQAAEQTVEQPPQQPTDIAATSDEISNVAHAPKTPVDADISPPDADKVSNVVTEVTSEPQQDKENSQLVNEIDQIIAETATDNAAEIQSVDQALVDATAETDDENIQSVDQIIAEAAAETATENTAENLSPEAQAVAEELDADNELNEHIPPVADDSPELPSPDDKSTQHRRPKSAVALISTIQHYLQPIIDILIPILRIINLPFNSILNFRPMGINIRDTIGYLGLSTYFIACCLILYAIFIK